MPRIPPFLLLAACLPAAPVPTAPTADGPPAAGAAHAHWPQFRGPSASGLAEGPGPPDAWDVPGGSNVRWKTPLPGLAHASPVVWGDRVFAVTAVSKALPDPTLRTGLYGDIAPIREDSTHAWRACALSLETGKVLWEETLHEGVPRVQRHPKSSHASSTPATDGKTVVFLLGSEGLHGLDLDGKRKWRVDLGVLDAGFYLVPEAQWAFGSSPVVWRGMVIVQCDVQKGAFLAAFDLETGAERWRAARDDVPTWSTPLVVEGAGRAELVVNGYRHAGGYDPSTGKELWRLSGGGDIPVPTPVAAHGLVFITNAHGRLAPIYAVRAGASGDISLRGDEGSNAGIAWSKPREGSYMQTPIVVGEHIYACRDNGVLSYFEARTGTLVWRERLGGGTTGFTASPVAASGRLYFTSEEGDVHVLRAGPRFEEVSVNSLGEQCMATPAIVRGLLIARTKRHMVAIGAPIGAPEGRP
ncbi:MAG: PQQ-binding-like beta-propeller repeat protein [Planctomycetes bacterium]|nr:PQQ-binding-like beta-propeller repeat protein [Planctomycetota bacterium]